MQSVAGYTFQEILDASHSEVEHWKGVGNQGVAEIFLVPRSWKSRIEAIPRRWDAFCDFEVQSFGSKLAVIIPGFLHSDLYTLQRLLGPQAAVVFAWHIASSLALLHDSGSAHGLLHAQSIGLDEEGKLCIRPGLLAPIQADPDKKANAQATDCWQLAHVLELLIGGAIDDERIRLLIGGLKQDRATIRLQPARALRQSLVAITENNPSWEEQLKKVLGDAWGMDQLPPIEHSIIPKLYPKRPRAQLPQHVDPREYNPWSSPFVSTKSESLDTPKKISLPSSLKTEQKLKLPSPSQKASFLEEEVDIQEYDEQAPAQIRLPFVSVVANTISLGDTVQETLDEEPQERFFEVSEEDDCKEVSEEDVVPFVVSIEQNISNQEPKRKEDLVVTPQEEMKSSLVDTNIVEPNHPDAKKSTDSSEKTLFVEPSVVPQAEAVLRIEAQVDEIPEPTPEETRDSLFDEETSQDLSPETLSEETPSPETLSSERLQLDDNDEPLAEFAETRDSLAEEPLKKENAIISDKSVIQIDPESSRSLQIPQLDDDFIDFIDEEALLSEEDTMDVSEERTIIAVETKIEKIQIEQVEEVLLPEQNVVPPKQRELSSDASKNLVVPEFFDDSEEPIEDFDSFESEDEAASVSFYEDSVLDDTQPSQHEDVPEESHWEPEEDFLATIFNDRDIRALEASSTNNLTTILPKEETVEQTEYAKHSVSFLDKEDSFSEQVAGFETSHEESYIDDSYSSPLSEHSFSQQEPAKNIAESVQAAFREEPSHQQKQHDTAHSLGKEEPRWMAAKGITADPTREDELGSGKWGGAKSQLDQDILKEVMSATPVRELDLDDDGNGWALLLFGLAGFILVIFVVYGLISSL